MDQLAMIAAYLRARHLLPDDDRGATAVEYSLLAALIAGICILAVTGFGNQIASVFTSLTAKISIP
ncbi:Flp family type IVb pilin [Actinoplanes sp. NPDC020271]|uniref:Flp family type IVb pilin n=1 Tax=Actinoplanes sp. NPDC020271 TaxID=3363896 RepID=UPI003796CA0B